jgi:hypothetical protein
MYVDGLAGRSSAHLAQDSVGRRIRLQSRFRGSGAQMLDSAGQRLPVGPSCKLAAVLAVGVHGFRNQCDLVAGVSGETLDILSCRRRTRRKE